MTLYRGGIRSVAGFSSKVSSLVEECRLGDALDEVRAFVEGVIFDSRSVARVFMSTDLDRLCRQIGEKVLRTFGPSANTARSGSVILVTELVLAGGHVELIKDIVRLSLFGGPITVLLTDFFDRADRAVVDDFVERYGISAVIADGGNSQERLCSAFANLRSLAPARLILLTHNQDGIGVSLAHADVADKVIYIHHGDHHLSLGVTCTEFIHFDPHNIGFFHCRDDLGIENNRYWPLTVNGELLSPRSLDFLQSGALVSCCSGRSEKFDSSHYLYDYIELIPKLLAISRGVHLHIGDLSNEMKTRLHAQLAIAGVDEACFIHIPWVPSVARALIEHNVDLYVSSFPMGGGKAMVEAMAAGVPLLMHANYQTRFFSGIDIAYPDAFIWRTEDELLSIVSDMNAGVLASHSKRAREYYERFHSDSVLVDAAVFSKVQNVALVPRLRPSPVDALQTFLDETLKVSLVHDGYVAEIRRVNNEWSKAMSIIDDQAREIERVNSEWLKAVNIIKELTGRT